MVSKDIRDYISNKPHAQSTFEKYIINVDLEGLNNVDLEEENSDRRYNMLDVSGLNYFIDSLYTDRKNDYQDLSKTLYNRSTFDALSASIEPSIHSKFNGGNILELYNTSNNLQILNLALNTVNSSKQVLESNKLTFEKRKSWLNSHIIALHEKYVLGFACVILFFLGAPLGALIRKGGLGLPMVIAILLFLSYHFIGLFAKNSAKDGALNSILGTWLSTLITLPLSIYLTSRATKDRGLFEIDFITVPIKKFFNFNSSSDYENIQNVQSYSYYNKYSEEQLVEVIKHQDAFALDKKPKQIALQHLSDRNVSLDTLSEYGLQVPSNLQSAKRLLMDFRDYSKTTLVSYILSLVLFVLHFVFKNNKMPELALTLRDLSGDSLLVFRHLFCGIHYGISQVLQNFKSKSKTRETLANIIGLTLLPYKVSLFSKKHESSLSFGVS